MLAEMGHDRVWDYGWSLYLTLIEMTRERAAHSPG
jgi:hypothetical protein